MKQTHQSKKIIIGTCIVIIIGVALFIIDGGAGVLTAGTVEVAKWIHRRLLFRM